MANRKKTKSMTPPKTVSLKGLFRGLQKELEQSLRTASDAISHPSSLGDVTESDWIGMLRRHLPARYCVDKAFVVDSTGALSEQLDLVIYDKQYSLVVFRKQGAIYIPAESVYAIFEVKQSFTAAHVKYAMKKAASVRRLERTSVQIMSAMDAKPSPPQRPKPILAGLLSYRVSWKDGLGKAFQKLVAKATDDDRLDVGCCLQAGAFNVDYSSGSAVTSKSAAEDALVSFFMTLLHRLQPLGTVTAIDFTAYGKFTLGKKHGG